MKQRISIPEEVKKKCVELLNSGKSPLEIYENFYKGTSNASYDTFARTLRNWKKLYGAKSVELAQEESENRMSAQSAEYKSDGSATFEGIISLMEGEPITPEIIMHAHNLDSAKWDVMAYKTNFWQAQAKGGRKMLLYQSKITVKPKETPGITFEDIDQYFETKDYSKDKLPIECLNYDKDGVTVEVDMADAHAGLLAWRSDSGNDYDLKIAKKRFFECINDIRERCSSRKIKKIVLVSLGDFLHIDNGENSTSHGTRQDADGRIGKIVEYAEDMLIDGITILGQIAPVEFIHIIGNHDEITGVMLARSVANAFRNDGNVTFDVTPNPIKHRLFGKNLVLFHHGNLPKANIDDLIYKHAREDFGKSKYSEIHLGHLHTEIARTKVGTTIRNVTAITGSSYWENSMGYKAPIKAVTTFVWDDERGLRDIWYSNV